MRKHDRENDDADVYFMIFMRIGSRFLGLRETARFGPQIADIQKLFVAELALVHLDLVLATVGQHQSRRLLVGVFII